jgi:hypothetical protein
MKLALSIGIVGSFLLIVFATLLGWDDLTFFDFQHIAWFRNLSGSLLFLLLLLQWALSIGRLIYRETGARWQRWVAFHQTVALGLPVALCIHSIALGYGLLAVLPLILLVSMAFGVKLMGQSAIKPWLPLHLVFSALTMGATLVHLWRVICFR